MSPDPTSAAAAVDRRRFMRASLVGGLAAGLVFAWMLTEGRFALFAHQRLGDFYEAQARSLLHGHWDVPRDVVGIEGIVVGGRTFIYFGPFPALLRLPVVVVTSRLDGRLTQLSMLAAFAVAMVSVARLSWRARFLVRGHVTVTRREAWLTAAFTATVGAGSVLLFLSSRAFVYHEAILWAVALSLAAYDQIVAFCARPSRRAVVLAGALAALAALSRGSVGFGPAVALGLVLTGAVVARLRGRPSYSRRRLLALAAATAVPLALYVYVNEARFGTLFSVPYDKQVQVQVNAERKAALEANGGSFFGAKFVPTTTLQYARPDALSFGRLFPWVTFPRRPARVVGSARFDTIDPTSSVPASMPVLVLLGFVGLAALANRRLAAFRAPVAGAAAGGALALTIGYVAQRYIGDLFPPVLLCAVAGFHVVQRARRRGRARSMVAGALVALAAFSAFANPALALVYQRSLSVDYPEARLAAFVRSQHRFDARLFARRTHVRAGPSLPRAGRRDELFLLGPCAGVYWSDGRDWHAIEETNATGHFRLRVPSLDDLGPGDRRVLLSSEAGRQASVLSVEGRRDGRVAFGYSYADAKVDRFTGPPVHLGRGAQVLDVVLDRRLGHVRVTVDGRSVLGLNYFIAGTDHFVVVPAVQSLPVRASFCRFLQRRGAPRTATTLS